MERQKTGNGQKGWVARDLHSHPRGQFAFPLDIYGKDEADDLSIDDKKVLQAFAKQIVLELKERYSQK